MHATDGPGTPGVEAPRSGALGIMRRGASSLHVVLTALVVVAVFAQVYLIGAYVFGAGSGALDAHKSVGLTTHAVEITQFLLALVAWLARPDLILALALAVIGTVQIALADSTKWVGALHPLLALVVLALAGALTYRGIRRHRPAGPSARVG